MTHSCERHEPSRRCYCCCGCRCEICREHHRQYAAHYSRQKAYGVQHRVVAEPVREHVRKMIAAGIGWRRVAKAAGVSPSSVYKLLHRGSKTVNKATADKLYAARPQLADGRMIPAGEYRAALETLMRRGWRKVDLGRWITGNPKAISLQLHHDLMRVSTAKRIVELVNLIEADRLTCMVCGVKVRGQVLCGGCRVRVRVKA